MTYKESDETVTLDLLESDTDADEAQAVSLCTLVYGLPKYQLDGKSGPTAERQKIGKLDNTGDMQEAIKTLVKRPGDYVAEVRVGGAVAKNKVFTVRAAPHTVALDDTQPARQPGDSIATLLQEMSARLRRVERGGAGRTDARRSERVRFRSRGRSTTAQADGDSGALALLKEQLQDMRERERAALARERQANEQRLAENERRLADMEARLNERTTRGEAPTDTTPILSTLLSQVLVNRLNTGDERIEDRLLDRVLGDQSEEDSKGGWGGAIKAAIENPQNIRELANSILPLAGMLKAQMPSPATQPQASTRLREAPPPQGYEPTPAPSPTAPAQEAPATFESESTRVLNDALVDLSNGHHVRDAARDIIRLMKQYPDHAGDVESFFLRNPPATFLQLVGWQFPMTAPITTKPEAPAWIGDLQADVRKRLDKMRKAATPEAPTVAPASAEEKTA